jgi:HAD superfamily hydrolase (TIGR01509 family)
MDGLLLDTEKISLSTFLEACRHHGYQPDVQVYYKIIGTTSQKTHEVLMEGYGPDFPLEAIFGHWRQNYRVQAIEQPVPVKEGVLNLLSYLEDEAIRKIVVTSTQRANAERMLANAQILSRFEFVMGGDQISKGKPDPEIYLTACRKLGAVPAHCLALEDSENGVLSAFRAGLIVVQVPDLLPPSDAVRSLGHCIVGTLSEAKMIIQEMRRSN